MLRRQRPAEEYREALETLLPEIVRLSSLVTDLLTLSRVEAGHLVESFTPCDLAEIAESVAASFSSRAVAKEGEDEAQGPEDHHEPERGRGAAQ